MGNNKDNTMSNDAIRSALGIGEENNQEKELCQPVKIPKDIGYDIAGDFYVQSKVVARTLNDCRLLCIKMTEMGLGWDGIIQDNGVTYFAILTRNNNLLNDK